MPLRIPRGLAVPALPNAIPWLDNADLRPVPYERRTWGFWTYTYFWISAAATVSNWYSPSAFIAFGLSAWEACAVHLAGQFLAGATMALTGRPGAVYHIGFPVLARASFGCIGAFWPILNRALMSIIWNGLNLVQAGQCFYVMLRALAPSIGELPDIIDKNDALNTGGFTGMLIAWILVLGSCYFTIPQLKYLLHIKLAVFGISSIAMLCWTITFSEITKKTPEIALNSGIDSKRWLIVKFILLSWANCSTFIVNAADYQRYARRPHQVLVGQLIGFPIGNFVVGLVGIFVARTSEKKFGELIWNPISYLDRLLDAEIPATRVACFFIALFFSYSCLFSCIYENVLPAGNDIAALCPKYISVRRGSIICVLLSVACLPWKLLGSASAFVEWLSAYQIFLSAISGVMLSHFYIVSHRRLKVEDLFISKESCYWYYKGINWRAILAYGLGIAPNFYGFLGNLGVDIPLGAQRAYYFSYPLGIFVSLVVFSMVSQRPQREIPDDNHRTDKEAK